MIVEHAILPVTIGREAEFEASMIKALSIIESAPNCFGAEVRRQDEDDSIYLLLVRWSSVGAHMAFRESALFTQWRDRTHPFYRSPPSVTHFHQPLER